MPILSRQPRDYLEKFAGKQLNFFFMLWILLTACFCPKINMGQTPLKKCHEKFRDFWYQHFVFF